MSAYIDFVIVHGKEVVPLCSFSRSDPRFQAICDEIPFGSWSNLDSNLCGFILRNAEEDTERWKKRIADEQKQIAEIGQFNNTMEEKLEAINDINNSISEWEDMLDDSKLVLEWYRVMAHILEDYEITKSPSRIMAGYEAVREDIFPDRKENENE